MRYLRSLSDSPRGNASGADGMAQDPVGGLSGSSLHENVSPAQSRDTIVELSTRLSFDLTISLPDLISTILELFPSKPLTISNNTNLAPVNRKQRWDRAQRLWKVNRNKLLDYLEQHFQPSGPDL